MNRLKGIIKTIQTAETINKVVVSCMDTEISCVTLDLPEDFQKGREVSVIFKETEVALAKNIEGAISISNLFACVVEEVDEGKILSQVKFLLNESVLSSIITTDSLKRLDIKAGDSISALIKANEVSLERIEN